VCAIEADQGGLRDTGDSGDTGDSPCRLGARCAVAAIGVDAQLAAGRHALTCLLDVVVAQPGPLSDGLWPAVWVVADEAQDRRAVWVPNRSSTSCDLGISVYQSTEPIATLDAKLGKRRRGWERLEWRCLVQCPVRPMGVEVRHVLG
jgi:hypothetical protein